MLDRESYDDLSSRVQAIEELLVETLSIPAPLLRRRQKTIRKKLHDEHRAEMLAFANQLLADKYKRQRKLLDKASGRVQ